ncbi:MAG TPA: hypothetical protein VFQ45_09105 [Longimicrobium sp.]|nr:hypothetical protein [Longimicrobium sp.]
MIHPVWSVYDEYRTLRLNVNYYRCKLGYAVRVNFIVECLIAATSSTAVGGLWFFSTAAGGVVWKILATLAALLSVYQTVAKPSDIVRKLEETVTAFSTVEADIEKLCRKIKTDGRYTKPMMREFEALVEKRVEISHKYMDAKVNKNLRAHCTEEVLKQLPLESFYIPPPEVRDDTHEK